MAWNPWVIQRDSEQLAKWRQTAKLEENGVKNILSMYLKLMKKSSTELYTVWWIKEVST